jgi:hypothetical protein
MKSIKHIALTVLLSIGAFGAVLYTSCNKDKCKDVTCQNSGTCSDGNCTCPTGVTGTNCETIYRTGFVNTYKGNGTDNAGGTYNNFRMVFAATGTDVTKMSLTIQDASGGSAGVPVLTVDLANFSASGATFTVESNSSAAGFTYTGTGSISGTSASLSLIETPTTGSAITYTFNNFAKQ